MTQIYNLNYKLGSHNGFSGKISDTLFDSINYGMYSTQFFMGHDKNYNRACISDEDIENCKIIMHRYPMHLFTHFPYIANLAGSIASLAWNGDIKQDMKTKQMLHGVQYELDIMSNFKNSGVVIHPGSFKDRKKGLNAISKSINYINFNNDSKLILENASGQGTALATTFEEIKTIIDGIEPSKRRNIGVCIDTCHIYAYGGYDLGKKEEIYQMFQDFDNIIGLEKLSLIHLNDSKTKFKKKTDRHAKIMNGYIWDIDSLTYFLETCKKIDVPLVLETDKSDILKICRIQS
jgi:deoxyribonuclease-4